MSNTQATAPVQFPPKPCIFQRVEICTQPENGLDHSNAEQPCDYCSITHPAGLWMALRTWLADRTRESGGEASAAENITYNWLNEKIMMLWKSPTSADQEGHFPCMGRQFWFFYFQFDRPSNENQGQYVRELVRARKDWLKKTPAYHGKDYLPCGRTDDNYQVCKMCRGAVTEEGSAELKAIFKLPPNDTTLKGEHMEEALRIQKSLSK